MDEPVEDWVGDVFIGFLPNAGLSAILKAPAISTRFQTEGVPNERSNGRGAVGRSSHGNHGHQSGPDEYVVPRRRSGHRWSMSFSIQNSARTFGRSAESSEVSIGCGGFWRLSSTGWLAGAQAQGCTRVVGPRGVLRLVNWMTVVRLRNRLFQRSKKRSSRCGPDGRTMRHARL